MKRSMMIVVLGVVICALFQSVARGDGERGGKSGKANQAARVGFNDAPSAVQVALFEKKIRPVLIARCYKCHSAMTVKPRAGLRLDTRAGIRKGGISGPAIAPQDPEKSLLLQAIRYKNPSLQMPPQGKLSAEVIADFEAWVMMGAPDPRDGGDPGPIEIDIVKGRKFWAFRPPEDPAPLKVRDAVWPKSGIDRFVLAGLEARGLTPARDADRRTLIRRVTFDLTGLPPTPEEVEAFITDASPGAFEKVVDWLLASPRFGERWGRHWLDVARYAETTGKTVNFNYPQAWRYRDYVIAALNADKPYNQFVKEQLAGDLMPTTDTRLKAERTVATGFLAVGVKALNEPDALQFELDGADEQIDVTSIAFLGVTVACARCHDHKIDPIPQRDYYALAGIFRSTETFYGTVRVITYKRPSPLILLPNGCGLPPGKGRLTTHERQRIEDYIAELKNRKADPVRKLFVDMQITLQQSKLNSYDAEGKPKLLAMGVRDRAGRGIADSRLFVRGDVDKPGELVPRGFLQVLSQGRSTIGSGSGRAELADWLVSGRNPLTARVMVNRVWLHLFGRGIVPTCDNFGAAGQPPTNPELLDHLAATFVADGWAVKKLIRRIVLSRAYQLDSVNDPKKFEADPDNARVWRMTPRRLDAEALRDAVLAVSGLIDLRPVTGSIITRQGEGPTNEPGLNVTMYRPIDDPQMNCRSVYLPMVRNNLHEALSLFDGADPSLSVSERPNTTTPSQSLYFLNSPFLLRASDAAAERLIRLAPLEAERVRQAYRLFFGRGPTDGEAKAAATFLGAFRAVQAKVGVPASGVERVIWSAYCQALYASYEFQYRR